MVDEDSIQKVIFDVNIPVSQNDVDILELFISNKNQTDSLDADLISFDFDSTTKKRLTVVYNGPSVRETILSKRFFHFDRYFLRASVSGYMNEMLKADAYRLIHRNCKKPNLKKKLGVIGCDKSKFFKDTFYVTFENPIDEGSVKSNVLHAFHTSTILIGKRTSGGQLCTNVRDLMTKLTKDIVTRLGARPNLFLDEGSKFVLCQFKSELDTSTFMRSIESYLEANQLICEYLYNFKLTKGEMNRTDKKLADFFDKPTQTEESVKTVYREASSKVNNVEIEVIILKESRVNSGEIREVSPRSNCDVVYEHFNDSLKGIPKSNKPPKFSMQISAQTGNALLCECLFKCAKILYDFKRDLETILPSCKLNTDAYQTSFIVTFKQSDFDSAISKNLFANLITSYERNRLKEEIFRTKSKENIPILLQSFNQKKELETFKSKLNIYFNSVKCVYAEYNKMGQCFEIRGYAQAVQCFLDWLKTLQSKTMRHIEQKGAEKRSFIISVAEDSRVNMLFKFDEYYMKDFQRRLGELKATAVLKRGTQSVLISQMDSVNSKEAIYSWRTRVDTFIREYMMLFDSAVIDLPFSRDSEEAFRFLYDKYALDAVWMSDTQVKVFGVKQNIEEFHQRVYACQINEVM